MSNKFGKPSNSSHYRQLQLQQESKDAYSEPQQSNDSIAEVQSRFSLPTQVSFEKAETSSSAYSIDGLDTGRVPLPSVTEQPTIEMPALPFSIADLATSRMPVAPIPQTPPIFASDTPAPRPIQALDAIDSDIREEVERYVRWLANNNQLKVAPEKMQAYQDEALKLKKVRKREIRTFAPFRERTSALRVITPMQIFILFLLLGGWGVGLYFLHLTMVTITLACISLLYIFGFLTSSILATHSFRGNSGEQIDEKVIRALDQFGVEWPTYTILCPLFKETAVVPQFVEAMKALDYPEDKLQVLFLTEESDKETRAALYSMGFPKSFAVLTVPKGSPQTKPRACNFGLLQARGQFVVIFDAEDKPEPYQLKKAVLTFANHRVDVACVQAKLNYYNSRQNLLTRWFTAEYSTWFDIMLPGLQQSNFSLPLGGTSNHFRTEALRALGGWDAFNVTEDCDLGLRISQYGLQTAVLDSTTYEEATSRVKVWLFQRSRWIKGYLQTYLVHMRHPLEMIRRGQFRKFFSLQLIVGAWTIVLLINPIMWALTIAYLVWHPVALYQALFPGPVLYMGAFCLVFGNFFYIYTHALGCLKRQEYSLLKWVLLLPLYWIMMSISAYIAFYQLIVKPHYWAKTQHGNHLVGVAKTQKRKIMGHEALEERSVVSSMPTTRVLAVKVSRGTGTLDSTTQRVKALRKTLDKQLEQRQVRHFWTFGIFQNPWLIAVLVIALSASIGSTIYMAQHHLILIYGDAYSRLLLSRSILDSATPGLAQLGGDWLPLPHLVIALFVWNNYLWQTGLAGSIAGTIFFLVATIFVFLSARRLTHSNLASFIGSLVFVLNLNVLYLQSTPLTEPACWATFTMACYFMLAWVQEDKTKYLVLTAASTFLASLARYDGWILIGIFPVMIIITDLVKRHPLRRIEANLGIFILLGSLGAILWLAWGAVIFHNPLYFIDGPYSSHMHTATGYQGTINALITHHLGTDLRIYLIDSIETIGTGLSLLAFLAIIVYVLRKWKSVEVLAGLAFLAPFVFYCVALYVGQVNLLTSAEPFYPLGIIPIGANSNLFNARFGSEMVAPAAIFIATLVPAKLPPLSSFFRLCGAYLGRAILIIVIILQTGWMAYGGVISIIADVNPPFCVQAYPVNVYLQEHYNGGHILHAEVPFLLSEGESGIDFSNVIYDGSGVLWQKALKDPAAFADWIVMTKGDAVYKAVAHDKQFSKQFTLVAKGPMIDSVQVELYHKNGLAPLPTHPISSYLLGEQQMCTFSNYQGT